MLAIPLLNSKDNKGQWAWGIKPSVSTWIARLPGIMQSPVARVIKVLRQVSKILINLVPLVKCYKEQFEI